MSESDHWKIVFVDDEEHHLVDYREKLRSQGNAVLSFNKLSEAYAALVHEINERQKNTDEVSINLFVVIDFMMPGQSIPIQLRESYGKIAKVPGKNNQGQAIGQWLWEQNMALGERQKIFHCYFSNLPDMYLPPVDQNNLELCAVGNRVLNSIAIDEFQEVKRLFVLNKTKIRPSMFFSKLMEIVKMQKKQSN